jgi:hypothetical protein
LDRHAHDRALLLDRLTYLRALLLCARFFKRRRQNQR